METRMCLFQQVHVRELGGLSLEYYEDYLGFKHKICDLGEGFGHRQRSKYVFSSNIFGMLYLISEVYLEG